MNSASRSKAKTKATPAVTKKVKEATVQAWAAIFLSAVAAAMFIAGIIIPPPGEIHPSVIQGIGLMIVLVAIFFAWDATVRGLSAKFEHGNTKVSIGGKSKRKKPELSPEEDIAPE